MVVNRIWHVNFGVQNPVEELPILLLLKAKHVYMVRLRSLVCVEVRRTIFPNAMQRSTDPGNLLKCDDLMLDWTSILCALQTVNKEIVVLQIIVSVRFDIQRQTQMFRVVLIRNDNAPLVKHTVLIGKFALSTAHLFHLLGEDLHLMIKVQRWALRNQPKHRLLLLFHKRMVIVLWVKHQQNNL